MESVASKLARRIRRMRERIGMNQTQLAALVLCSKSHISDIELEHVLPTSAEIQLMEKALDADGVLLELYNLLNIGIQIMPFTCTQHPGGDGPLIVIEYADKPAIWFTEGPRSGRMSNDRQEVLSAMHTLNMIRAAALPVHESIEYIRSTRESRYER